MVPAAVLVKREAAAVAAAAAGSSGKPAAADQEVKIGPGFGLAPVQRATGAGKLQQHQRQPQQQPDQLQGKWGSAVTVVHVPAGSKLGGGGAAAATAAAGKPRGVDEKLADFMDSLKDLGAFE
jgi:hypothetical protein